MQRSYLSLSLSRAWGMDNPIGDPFGGPAYGQRAMPVVAVAAAAMSVSAGVGMLAAGTAILGSTMLGTVVAGALIAGGALSIAGTVTGNQKLSKIGNTLQMVGGVGAFAASATGTMTSTAGMAEGAAGRQMSLSEATKVGVDKIATSFDSTMGTNIGNQVSNALGATGAEASMLKANMPAPIVPIVPGAPPPAVAPAGVAPGGAPVTGVAPGAATPPTVNVAGAPAVNVAGTPTVNVAGAHLTPEQIKALANAGSGIGWNAPTMMAASMGTSAIGSFMNAQAQEKAAEMANAKDEATKAAINAQIHVVNTQAEYDRLNREGKAVMFMPPSTLTAQAPTAPPAPPNVNPGSFNMAGPSAPGLLGTASAVNTGTAVQPGRFA